jgi:hypothetical protein
MFRHLPDGSYFEHWAKERYAAIPHQHTHTPTTHKSITTAHASHTPHTRTAHARRCILPASAFPYYHNNAQKKHMNHWWYRRGQEAQLAKLLVANITESSSDDSDAAAAATADEKRLRRAMKKVVKEVKEKGPQVRPGLLTPINNERHVTNSKHSTHRTRHRTHHRTRTKRRRTMAGRRRGWRWRCCGASAGW